MTSETLVIHPQLGKSSRYIRSPWVNSTLLLNAAEAHEMRNTRCKIDAQWHRTLFIES